MNKPIEKDVVLHLVAEYSRKDRRFIKDVIEAAIYGAMKDREELMTRAADLECALSVSLARRNKSTDGILVNILKRIAQRGFLAWEDEIAKLEGKAKN
jgi:hypothetical protein